MKLLTRAFFSIILILIISCHSSKQVAGEGHIGPHEPGYEFKRKPVRSTKTDSLLENLLAKYPQYFDSILRYRDTLRVQIIYTQINRDAKNSPVFTNYYFNVNPQKYF